jgi:predicted phosphate transport protein (TIGR00153 family)
VFSKREGEVITLVREHLDKVDKCLHIGLKAVEAYLKGDISMAKSIALEVDDIETQADFIRYGIWDRLYSGMYLPILRENIYYLVEKMDKICNAAEACCDFFMDQRPEVPNQLNSQFLGVAQESFATPAPLKEGMLTYINGKDGFEFIWQKAKQVGIRESDVDKLEWDLTQEIFASSLDRGHKIHLKFCLDAIVDISDRAEDAARQLELATTNTVM